MRKLGLRTPARNKKVWALTSPLQVLVPWVPLTHSDEPPEVVLTRCRERIDQVTNPSHRAGLLAVTELLAALAYMDRKFLGILGGPQMIIESPLMDEVREIIRAQGREEGQLHTLRSVVVDALTTRFGQIPMDQLETLNQITGEDRLKTLFRLALTCPDLETFLAGLKEPGK